MKKKRKLGCFISLSILLFPIFLVLTVLVAFTGANYDELTGCPISVESTSTLSSVSSEGASQSDWTLPGTVAYNNAKYTFDVWVSLGVSGAMASGITGWLNSEGGFAMVGRAEGHYGSSLEENSIAYGVRPVGLSYYTTEAGGGIYQITPFSRYAPLGSPDWEDIEKMTKFVFNEIKKGDWVASMDMSGKNRSFREAAQESDPKSATLAWQAYERGNVQYIHVDQKQSDAQKAYEMFGGENYKFDAEKFDKFFGSNEREISEIIGTELKDVSDSSESLSDRCGSSSGKAKFSGDTAHLFNEPYVVIQPYGYTPWSQGGGAWMYPKGYHDGVDVVTVATDYASRDIPVFSITDGEVAGSWGTELGGFAIVIKADSGGYIYYGHIKYHPTLKVGEKVKKGDQIAVLGNTGAGGIYHVHLQYTENSVDPLDKSDKDPTFLIRSGDTLKQDEVIKP